MIGTQVGGYRIESKLGEGGMGEVYAASHALMGKRVAVKVLRAEHSHNGDVVNRFFREARATALLNHPGCVDIIDTGRLEDGRAYLVMSLLEGESLKDRLVRERLRAPTLISITRQIADVLSAAHQKGIIHRDLKPDNVFLVPDGGDPSGVRAKVLDFGVAKLADGFAGAPTNPSAIIGTPAYMSPEQCKGAAFVDSQSDIYSLGCMMFEMACGRPPFVCQGFGDYLMAHWSTPVPRPSSFAPVDAALERVILRALAKTKEERHGTMAELIAELDAVERPLPAVPRSSPEAATLVGASLPTLRGVPVPAVAPPRRRRGLWLMVGALAVATAAAALVAMLLLR
jgi:eukaryotic-like serine/threonine-protein kinase